MLSRYPLGELVRHGGGYSTHLENSAAQVDKFAMPQLYMLPAFHLISSGHCARHWNVYATAMRVQRHVYGRVALLSKASEDRVVCLGRSR